MKKITLIFIIILLLLIPSIVLAQDLPEGLLVREGFFFTSIPIQPITGYQHLIGVSFNVSYSFGSTGIGVEYCYAWSTYYPESGRQVSFRNHCIRVIMDIFYFTVFDILNSIQPFIGFRYYEGLSGPSDAYARAISVGFKHLWGREVIFLYYGLVYTAIVSYDGHILSGGFTQSHLAFEIGVIIDAISLKNY